MWLGTRNQKYWGARRVIGGFQSLDREGFGGHLLAPLPQHTSAGGHQSDSSESCVGLVFLGKYPWCASLIDSFTGDEIAPPPPAFFFSSRGYIVPGPCNRENAPPAHVYYLGVIYSSDSPQFPRSPRFYPPTLFSSSF